MLVLVQWETSFHYWFMLFMNHKQLSQHLTLSHAWTCYLKKFPNRIVKSPCAYATGTECVRWSPVRAYRWKFEWNARTTPDGLIWAFIWSTVRITRVSVSLNNFKLRERGGGVSSLSRLLKCVKVGSTRLNMLINRIIGPYLAAN